MNRDIRLSTEFWDHPKTVKLERRLGLQGPKSLQILWAWAAKYHPDGRLEGEDVEAIEIAAKWPGNDRSTTVEGKSTFVETLLTLRWLDLCDETYCLHDWREHNSWAAEADSRSDKSRLSRMAKTHPELYKKLTEGGRQGISRDEYEALTTVERSLNDRKRVLQAQGPLPSPIPEDLTALSADAETTVGIPTEEPQVGRGPDGDKIPEKCRDGSPVAYAMTVQGGGQVRISEKQVAEWEKAFPSIPVKSELFRIQTWSRETTDPERWKKKEAFMATCNLLAKKNTMATPIQGPKQSGRVPHYV